jgi:hypothetical protein
MDNHGWVRFVSLPELCMAAGWGAGRAGGERKIKKYNTLPYRGIRDTSRQISFEFLFIKTRSPDKLHNGFGFVIKFRV